MGKKIPQAEYNNIVKLYQDGLSIEKIQLIYNTSNTSIRTVLQKTNTPTRDRSHQGRIYHIDENYFDNIDTPNKAYVLGLLYADGCNYTPQHRIALVLQKRDRDVLYKIRDDMNSNHPISIDYKSKKNPNHQDAYGLIIANKHLSRSLEEKGVVQNKSLILTYPEWLPNKLAPDFIRGYFDGDGHIEWSNSRFLTLVSTDSFCKSVQNILLEEFSVYSTIKDAPNNNGITRLLSIYSKNNIVRFLSLIYGNNCELYIKRKYDLARHIIDSELSKSLSA